MNPCPCAPTGTPAPTDLRIAQLVAQEIPDGAVLSLGVGGVPFAVAKYAGRLRHRRIWAVTPEPSATLFWRLFQAGKLTNSRKEVDRGYATWNLAMGSQELYDWLDREPGAVPPRRCGLCPLPGAHRADEQCDQHQRRCGTGPDGPGERRESAGDPAALRHRRDSWTSWRGPTAPRAARALSA